LRYFALLLEEVNQGFEMRGTMWRYPGNHRDRIGVVRR
jgi:hypothetical protein